MIYIYILYTTATDIDRYQTKTRKDRTKRRTNLAAAHRSAEDPAAVSRSDSLWTKRGHSCHSKPWQVTSVQTNCYTYLYISIYLSIHDYLTLCDIVWNSAHHWVHNGYRYPFALCKVTLDVALFLNPQCLELASPPRVRNSDHARLSTIQVELDSTNRK